MDQGLVLYQQSDWYDSQPLLEIAAEAGDKEAQYYLGEAIRLSKRYMTVEAQRWYEAAAKQGDLFAMLRLGNSDDLCHTLGTCAVSAPEWREKALELAYERAEKGDTEAMRALFHAGEGLVWLEKAAEAGDRYAQQHLASLYKAGEGWFLIPCNREKAIEKWLKASAEAGFPLGMMEYAHVLGYQNRVEEAKIWIQRSAEGGYVEAVYSYASYLAHMPDKVGYSRDLVKSYALFYLMSQLQGGGGVAEDARRKIKNVEALMSMEQVEEAEVFAEEWAKTHPPLSYFVPVYGY
ncbi:sel1 repeat family protein [Pseudomonas sp. AA-38]|uniref:tetratricopeptide repeat protein n=1 Tax=Pseudomonas sp. AA-38 TaxID=3028807 RepID=UPI0023F95F33|nr:sel1 repeat family protein [Pseudomonas sp. AA-38]